MKTDERVFCCSCGKEISHSEDFVMSWADKEGRPFFSPSIGCYFRMFCKECYERGER